MSLEVIGIDTDQSATYDYLLTLHSNHGPISHCFRNKWQYQTKIANFSHRCVFCVPADGVPFELGICAVGQKTRVMGLLGRTTSLMISSAVWIQCKNVTDGQTLDDSKDHTYT